MAEGDFRGQNEPNQPSGSHDTPDWCKGKSGPHDKNVVGTRSPNKRPTCAACYLARKRRWATSDNGRAAYRRYKASEKGRETQRRRDKKRSSNETRRQYQRDAQHKYDTGFGRALATARRQLRNHEEQYG